MNQTVVYTLSQENSYRRYGKFPEDYPRMVYIFLTDDGKVRTYHWGGKTDRRLRIFKSMDEFAPLLESMTLFNLYELDSSNEGWVGYQPDQCPWTHWNDNNHKKYLIASQHYSLKDIPLKEAQKMRRDDAWVQNAGLVMKDHYSRQLQLFHPSRDWECRKAARKSRKKIKAPF